MEVPFLNELRTHCPEHEIEERETLGVPGKTQRVTQAGIQNLHQLVPSEGSHGSSRAP